MKTNVFTPAVLLVVVMLALTACRSSRNTGGKYPDGNTSGRSYPDYDPNPNNLPPGQAKKIYGDKSAKKYAPGQRKKQRYPLIIMRTPDIVIGRADGRNFYRNPDGFYYWEGGDGRFYLDEKHLGNISYDKNEYNSWKARGNGNVQSSNSNAKSKGNGNRKGNGGGNGKGKSKS
jgi:hypothetical protein